MEDKQVHVTTPARKSADDQKGVVAIATRFKLTGLTTVSTTRDNGSRYFCHECEIESLNKHVEGNPQPW